MTALLATVGCDVWTVVQLVKPMPERQASPKSRRLIDDFIVFVFSVSQQVLRISHPNDRTLLNPFWGESRSPFPLPLHHTAGSQSPFPKTTPQTWNRSQTPVGCPLPINVSPQQEHARRHEPVLTSGSTSQIPLYEYALRSLHPSPRSPFFGQTHSALAVLPTPGRLHERPNPCSTRERA